MAAEQPGTAVDLSAATAVVREAELAMSLPRAWALMRDLSLSHHYVPGSVATEILGEPSSGLGASRRVYQREQRWLVETVLEWREQSDFLLSVAHEDGRSPLALCSALWFRYQLLPAGDGDDRCCRVRLTLYFRCRPWLAFMARPLAALMGGQQDKLLRRLLRFYRSSARGDDGAGGSA